MRGQLPQKATTLLTNRPLTSMELKCNHRKAHPPLVGRDCKLAENYPRQFCTALTKAVRKAA